jgi:hypothetical protein
MEVVRQTLTCSQLPGPAVIGSKSAVQMAIFVKGNTAYLAIPIACDML